MKKCAVCIAGSWTVALAGLAWGIVGVSGTMMSPSIPLRGALVVVGLTAIGFAIYQPPLRPCPRCEALTIAALKERAKL